jgi:hypothetical protein
MSAQKTEVCYFGRAGLNINIIVISILLIFVVMPGNVYCAGVNYQNKFIIGIFGTHMGTLGNIKQAGFNSVQTYDVGMSTAIEFIQETKKNGWLALLFPAVQYGDNNEKSEEKVKNIVLNNGGPNVIWYLADEPDLKKDPAARQKVSALNSAVKSANPSATTALTAGWWTDYDDWADLTDIFMIDIYPIGKKKYNFNDDVGKVSEYTKKAVSASKGKPVWVILQAFGYQDEKHQAWGWEREPTYEEERAMTYLAIINGAKGVFYYAYGGPGSGYYIEKSPQHWANVKSIVAELNNYLPVLTAEASGQIVVDALSGNKAIEYLAKKYQGKYYLFAVNGTRENVKVRIRERTRVFTEYFKPLETKIYVFEN